MVRLSCTAFEVTIHYPVPAFRPLCVTASRHQTTSNRTTGRQRLRQSALYRRGQSARPPGIGTDCDLYRHDIQLESVDALAGGHGRTQRVCGGRRTSGAYWPLDRGHLVSVECAPSTGIHAPGIDRGLGRTPVERIGRACTEMVRRGRIKDANRAHAG